MTTCSRRVALRGGVGGVLGMLAANGVLPSALQAVGSRRKTAKSCILLWMGGGPSHIDTFDPKSHSETGGPFKSIKTAVSGVRICEHLPEVAKQMRSISLIRSMTTREGNHERASYLLHTGYRPQAAVQHPGLGAIMSYELGQDDFALPASVVLGGGSVGPGYLGGKHKPFVVSRPGNAPDNMMPEGGVRGERHEDRIRMLDKFERTLSRKHVHAFTDAHREIYDRSLRLMKSPLARLFDVNTMRSGLRDQYNLSTSFGRGCLTARRLVEVGVPFVEVQLGGWDTHSENFDRTKDLMGALDPGFGTLVRDLRERGLLDETLVICMGEFGRTPRINSNAGRDHYPRAWSIAMAGGGIRGGRVVGATDAKGATVTDSPTSVADLYHTLSALFGINADKEIETPEGRPIMLIPEDGKIIRSLV